MRMGEEGCACSGVPGPRREEERRYKHILLKGSEEGCYIAAPVGLGEGCTRMRFEGLGWGSSLSLAQHKNKPRII